MAIHVDQSIAFEPSTCTVGEARTTKPHKPFLQGYHEIPSWYQDNPVIQHGYRPECNSYLTCLISLFYLHNESSSIYTHLFPAIFALYCQLQLLQHLRDIYPKATDIELRIFSAFFLGAALCFALSATYHTLLSHSERVASIALRCDYVGILALMLSKFVSGVYMCFYCEPVLQKTYWGMILTLGTITATILVSPVLQHRRYRTLRALSFVMTALSGFVPMGHGIWIFGVEGMVRQSGMLFYLLEGALLLVGVAFYVTRVPESLKPGYFDIWGSSHQVFHVLVVLAFVVHGIGIWTAFDYNYHHRKCLVL